MKSQNKVNNVILIIWKKAQGLFRAIWRLPFIVMKAFKKIVKLAMNPKRTFVDCKNHCKKIKPFLRRLPKLTSEYFFLLVMSSESYVWRLERKKFKYIPTVAETRTYQKTIRVKTFKFVFTGAMAILLVISLPGLFQNYFAKSKTYSWIQNNWTTGALTSGLITGTSATNWSEWWKFYSKTGTNAIDTGTAGALKLKNIPTSSGVENGTATFSYSGDVTNGTGAYKTGGGASTGIVSLKKPSGATCTSVSECAGATSTCNGFCCSDACCGMTTFADSRDTNNSNYGTMLMNDVCWMTRNINVGSTMLANTSTYPTNDSAIEKWCPGNNVANCNSSGALYSWAEANGLPASCDSATCTAAPSGVCPTGWHVSKILDWTVPNNGGYCGRMNNPPATMTNDNSKYWWPGNNSTDGSVAYLQSGQVYVTMASTCSDDKTFPKLTPASVRCVKNSECSAATTCGDDCWYGGEAYSTVSGPDGKCWFAKNLNVGTKLANGTTYSTDTAKIEKWCYDDVAGNCDTYGGLYSWAEANGLANSCNASSCTPTTSGICPIGWHVPSDTEWTNLVDVSSYGALSSLLNFKNGGYRYNSGGYTNLSGNDIFWSSTEDGQTHAWYRNFISGTNVIQRSNAFTKDYGVSVRCIK